MIKAMMAAITMALALAISAPVLAIDDEGRFYDRDRFYNDDRFHDEDSFYNEDRSFRGDRTAAGIERRQDRQRFRIQAGIRDGSISSREGARLDREQLQIERMERRFLADGRLSGREVDILHHRLDQASDHIRRARHDGSWR